MKTFKSLKKYEKPLLKEHGNLKKITKGAWQTTDNDGIQNRYNGS